jgi:hypothetical protein
MDKQEVAPGRQSTQSQDQGSQFFAAVKFIPEKPRARQDCHQKEEKCRGQHEANKMLVERLPTRFSSEAMETESKNGEFSYNKGGHWKPTGMHHIARRSLPSRIL